jgi:Fe-S-cluster containining protein
MSLGCAGCGDCCEKINAHMSRAWITKKLADPYVGGQMRYDLEFIAAHWMPERQVGSDKVLWECSKFDVDERRCTAYDTRPQVCRGYPDYGKDKPPETRFPSCSYWLDVPHAERPEGSYPLIPVTAI